MGIDVKYVEDDYIDVGYFAVGFRGDSAPSIAASMTVTGTLVAEGETFTGEVLTVTTGTMSVTGSVIRRSSASVQAEASETTVAKVRHRAFFGIGLSNDLASDIGNAYQASGVLPSTLDLTCTAILNQLLLDDYKYTVPAETRSYKIKTESRSYKIKD